MCYIVDGLTTAGFLTMKINWEVPGEGTVCKRRNSPRWLGDRRWRRAVS
jgi:hypothetical protein